MSVSCPSCGDEGFDGAVFCPTCGQLFHVTDPFVGRVVGQYRLAERIGDGGSSVVYRANDIEDGEIFAVKILLPQYTEKQDMVGRFCREARVMSQMKHESVVGIADFGRVTDLGFYLVMEWVKGETVRDYLKRHGPLPKALVLYLFSQLFDVLRLAHHNGVIHRDLKLENLMLVQGESGKTILKVLDFGVAHVHVDKGLTETGILVGTPRYMAPEQIRAEKNSIDARTDVYACGLMLLEMLTGRPAFHKETVSQLLYGQLHEMPPFLHQLLPDVHFSESLENVVRRAVQKESEKRFSSVMEFEEALRFAMLEDEGIIEAERFQIHLNIVGLDNDLATAEYRTPLPRNSSPERSIAHNSQPSFSHSPLPQGTMSYNALPQDSISYQPTAHGSMMSHGRLSPLPQRAISHSPLPRGTMSLGAMIEADHQKHSVDTPESTVLKKKKTSSPWTESPWLSTPPPNNVGASSSQGGVGLIQRETQAFGAYRQATCDDKATALLSQVRKNATVAEGLPQVTVSPAQNTPMFTEGQTVCEGLNQVESPTLSEQDALINIPIGESIGESLLMAVAFPLESKTTPSVVAVEPESDDTYTSFPSSQKKTPSPAALAESDDTFTSFPQSQKTDKSDDNAKDPDFSTVPDEDISRPGNLERAELFADPNNAWLEALTTSQQAFLISDVAHLSLPGGEIDALVSVEHQTPLIPIFKSSNLSNQITPKPKPDSTQSNPIFWVFFSVIGIVLAIVFWGVFL